MTENVPISAGQQPIWLIVSTAVYVVVGIAAILHPVVTGIATGLLLAVAFFVSGLASMTAMFAPSIGLHRYIAGVFAFLCLATSVLLIVYPLDGAVSLVWMIGAIWAAIGTLELLHAIKSNGHRLLSACFGIVDLIIGVAALFLVPSDALEVLAILVGLGFIFRAIWQVAFGFRVYRAQ